MAENDDDAEYLLILSLVIVCIVTLILFVVLFIWGNFLAGIFHFEFIMPYYWLFCIGFFAISFYQILTYWTLRTKDYGLITHTRVAQSISGSVSKIVLGLLAFGSLGLISGEIIGRLVGITTLGKTILPRIWRSVRTLDFSVTEIPCSEIQKISNLFPAGRFYQ